MGSLREIKERIGSVKSTLKVTSAMKLVASSKLRKAQRAIEGLRPYEETLNEVLLSLGGGEGLFVPKKREEGEPAPKPKVAVVAISSNSSLCGGFNVNAFKKASEVVDGYEDVEVHSLGRKMAESMRKKGFPSPKDYFELIAHPSYAGVTALAESLSARYLDGELSRVILVYNHFISNSHQEPVAETYLPFVSEGTADSGSAVEEDYIVEPSPEEVLHTLLPQVLMLKFYAAILDSAAAEHAARTIAMQTATDNAEDLLGELTREYNKGRQQKITAELLDLEGGMAEQ